MSQLLQIHETICSTEPETSLSNTMGRLPRLPGWDYSSPASYFITFQVHERRRLLSHITDGRVYLTSAGRVVLATARLLPGRFAGLTLDRLVIMPDHVHGILLLEASRESVVPRQSASQSRAVVPASFMAAPDAPIGKIIRYWKARSTRLIRRDCLTDFRWQSRYWDRVIRDDDELQRTRRYIELNPLRWES